MEIKLKKLPDVYDISVGENSIGEFEVAWKKESIVCLENSLGQQIICLQQSDHSYPINVLFGFHMSGVECVALAMSNSLMSSFGLESGEDTPRQEQDARN